MRFTERLANLPRLSRRAIALGVLLMLCLLAWWVAAMPLAGLATSQEAWRGEVSERIAHDRGIAKSAPELRRAFEALKIAPARSRLFDANSVVAETQLQNDLRASLLAGGVEPTTFKVLPDRTQQGLRHHRVEFSSVMNVEQLRAMYTHLAQLPRYVRIAALNIDAPQTQRAGENPKFTVLMEAQGYSLDTPSTAATSATRVAYAH